MIGPEQGANPGTTGTGPLGGAVIGPTGGILPEISHAQLGRNLHVGVRITAAATIFLFLAFAFAYFYLRALNSNHDWRPPHISPGQGYGIAMLVCVLGSIAAFWVGRRTLQTGLERPWRIAAGAAVALGLAALGVQAAQFANLGFGPTDGGYASVFLGWSGVFMATWFGGVYWIETLLAQSLRERRAGESEIIAPDVLLRPGADACMVFLYLLAILEVITYVVLYLV